MGEIINGLLTGLTLQLAIGPVFLFIINLALQRTIMDGIAGVFAVTLVDYFYITLAIAGIGKLLENKKFKKTFGIASSIVLVIFGMIILKGAAANISQNHDAAGTGSIASSFSAVFLLTISSPLTIVFFTSLFAAKALELKYGRNQLLRFGFGTGLATFLFMGSAVVLFSAAKGSIPPLLILALNRVVGCLLVIYGCLRLWKTVR